MGKKVTRLYDQFQPTNYKVHLDLRPDEMTFSGKLILSGKKTGKPNQRITLHQKALKFGDASIVHHGKKGDEDIKLTRINTQDSYDEVRLHTDKTIYPGSYTITLDFSGKIADNMTGLYPCYFEHEGKKKKLLATQFESHHAREVIPCIDEPEAKATFDLSLQAPTGLEMLSNMPSLTEKNNGNSKTITFETTPIMSPYLLAFVVGEMHCVESASKNGIVMKTWGHIAQPKESMEYANQEAVKVIDFFEEYFDTPFPLKKCDQVALPDFESGAMENWGLITYREIALLSDPSNPSLSSQQYISMVIGHELSHQWFGNLVTMKWWDDLWLNESFASLMEHVVLDQLHPDWHQWEHYASMDIIACSNRDVYKDVQSVRVGVNHPDEIHTLFDGAIVYAKGGRLIKMLMDYIGEDVFREGLKAYFKKHAYGNTTHDDLWEALSNASGKDIKSFMDPWLEQSGMPLVTVSGDNDQLSLSQSRFLLDGDGDKSLWPVPLLASSKVAPDIFTTPSTVVKTDAKQVLLNVHGSGHYFIKYEQQAQRDAAALAIQKQIVPAEARISMINDMLMIARRGDYSIVDVLKVICQCQDEPRDAVWSLILRGLGLAMMLAESDEAAERQLRKLKIELATKWYNELGWQEKPDDDPNQKLLRVTAISMMISGEDKGAIQHALQLYDQAKSIESLPSDLRGIIIGTKVRHEATAEEIEKLITLYKTTQNPDLQLSLASSLTHTKDPEVIQKLIDEGLSKGGFVRPQDFFRWFALLMRNRYSREFAWDWITSEWDRIEKDFGGGKALDHFIIYAAAPLHTRQWQKKFKDFFEPKMDQVVLTRNIKVALSEIEARSSWHERDLPKLQQYLG